MIVSGGWDNTIQVYDVRYRGPVHAFWGPHICGDSIAFKNDGYTMVTGSYRQDDALEVWDMRMFRKTRVIPWEGSGAQQEMFHDDMNIDEFAPETDNDEEAKVGRPTSVFS